MLYLGGVVLLEAWPVYRFLAAGLEGEPSAGAPALALGLGGAALLTGLAVWLPLRAGVSRMGALD